MLYEWIAEFVVCHPVKLLCKALSVSRSAFYAWQAGLTHQQDPLSGQVEEVFWKHKRRYGSRRIREELKEQGYTTGRRRISKLLKSQGLRAIQPRSYIPKTTDSSHCLGICPNLLPDLLVSAPNQVWVADITYIPVKEGWVYLAVIMDWTCHVREHRVHIPGR